jgi:hypothetical protein
MNAITGAGFAVTSMTCCGDEWIADALDQAEIPWEDRGLRVDDWTVDGTSVLFVLRDPVSWYREYILDVTKGLGEFHELDGEIEVVFHHLGREPEVALNVSALNICARQPGWLSRVYKMYELTLLPVWDRVAVMDYTDLAVGLKRFMITTEVDGAERLTEGVFEDESEGPQLFSKTRLDIQREEGRAYSQFAQMLGWSS